MLVDDTFTNREKSKNNGFMMSLFNEFGRLDGFKEVINFISFETKDSKGNVIKGCPLSLVSKLVSQFTRVMDYANLDFA